MSNYDLNSYINIYSENIISLIKYWVNNENTLKILKKHEISTESFIKEYAVDIIKYFIAVVKKEKEIGACPAIDKLLLFFKEKNISTSELFILCTGFKNAFIEFSYDLNISTLEIQKEINFIFEKNFSSVLEKYSKSIYEVQKELNKSIDIVDKYVIMSRYDLDGNFLSVSDAFCKITGYKEYELIGKSHDIITHKQTDRKIIEDIWNTIKAGNIWKGEIKNAKKDGCFF